MYRDERQIYIVDKEEDSSNNSNLVKSNVSQLYKSKKVPKSI